MTDLSFEIHPRFCITCFYSEENVSIEIIKTIKERLKSLNFELSKLTIQKLDNFEYKGFKHLG
ncbi:MAG: hypothetical protein ACXADY_18725 [Candidatus Hodarchaeales archaeon]|jgi:hypothetical protein